MQGFAAPLAPASWEVWWMESEPDIACGAVEDRIRPSSQSGWAAKTYPTARRREHDTGSRRPGRLQNRFGPQSSWGWTRLIPPKTYRQSIDSVDVHTARGAPAGDTSS